MDDQDLREAIIRVAHENPGKVRDALLPLLQKEAATGSIATAIEDVLGNVAVEVAVFLKKKFSEQLGNFGKPFDGGRYVRNVSTEIKSNVGKPGTMIVEARWNPRDATNPLVNVFATIPQFLGSLGIKDYSRDLSFSLEQSPKSVAPKLGTGFARDLDGWMLSITREWQKKQR